MKNKKSKKIASQYIFINDEPWSSATYDEKRFLDCLKDDEGKEGLFSGSTILGVIKITGSKIEILNLEQARAMLPKIKIKPTKPRPVKILKVNKKAKSVAIKGKKVNKKSKTKK